MAANTYDDARADGQDHGHGRTADSPEKIPAKGWWEITKAYIPASEDRVTTEAAGVTFFGLLSIFPALAALVSLYGLVANPDTVTQHLSMLNGIVPGGGMDLLNQQVQKLASTQSGALGFGAFLGIAVALWTSNQGTKAMFDALNIVYGEKEKRGFIWRTIVTLAFTLCAMLFVIVALFAVVGLPIVLNFAGLGQVSDILLRLVRWPVLFALIVVLLAVLYRYGPSRDEAKWRWVTPGSLFAAITWIVGSILFSWYVSRFGNYDATYGSLGAVIGFMTWMWISATVVLMGGELNAELEHQTERDTTKGPEKDMGKRGAKMADTVA